jgi:hypothetical protein
MAEISVPRFLNSIDALVWLAAHPAPIAALPGARRAEFADREPRAAAQQPQPTPEPSPPSAAAPALFSAEYVADVYARRLRRVMSAQAELLPAAMLAERRARDRS